MDVAVRTDHCEKIKENEKNDKYVDLPRKLKKQLWNMRLIVMPVVTESIELSPKVLVRELEKLEILTQIAMKDYQLTLL